MKAVSENGERLNIRKTTLREWRQRFAEQLRAQGVAANATARAVRGETRSSLKDGIYRAELRGESRFLRERPARFARERRGVGRESSPGKAKLLETRRIVIDGWSGAVESLLHAGQAELAQKIWGFIGRMPPPLTTEERLGAMLSEHVGARERDRVSERAR